MDRPNILKFKQSPMANPFEITPKEYSSCIDGFFVKDCAVHNRGAFSFVLLQRIDNASQGYKRFLRYFVQSEPGERLGGDDYQDFVFPKLAVSRFPKDQAVMVSVDCEVGIANYGDDPIESPIPNGRSGMPLDTSCHALATIDGMVYAVGPWRCVCRRMGPNHWQSIADRQSMPEPAIGPYGSPEPDSGFDAIDGFSANDIYCVGRKGDAWRFDGQRWHQCPIAIDRNLTSVCCAGDGHVYIGMQSGWVLRGREDKWTLIHEDTMTLPFNDMVWFEDKVWCTSDHGLWVIEDGKLRDAPVPAEVKACSGSLAVGDGVMLLAGLHGATVYDGNRWNGLW